MNRVSRRGVDHDRHAALEHAYTLEHAYIHYDAMLNDVDFIMMSIL